MDMAGMLRSYDGKRVAPFRAVAEAVRDTPERAVPRLLDLPATDEAALQVGATWVIKWLAERGGAPRGESIVRVLGLLDHMEEPDGLLHLLQTLPHMELPADRTMALNRTLRRLIRSRRVFVRAWAYNGLGVIAAAEPRLRNEIEALFAVAEERESAAVRARIRHARAGLASS